MFNAFDRLRSQVTSPAGVVSGRLLNNGPLDVDAGMLFPTQDATCVLNLERIGELDHERWLPMGVVETEVWRYLCHATRSLIRKILQGCFVSVPPLSPREREVLG
jgi:hypothetical protein